MPNGWGWFVISRTDGTRSVVNAYEIIFIDAVSLKGVVPALVSDLSTRTIEKEPVRSKGPYETTPCVVKTHGGMQ